MSGPYTPRPEHRFTFGLWTVGNPGRDPFGHEVRPPLEGYGHERLDQLVTELLLGVR